MRFGLSRPGSSRRWSLALLGLTVVAAAGVVGGTALAGHRSAEVKSYTGCLATKGGTLSLIAEGNAPQKPCSPNSVEAHFSGGDITRISVGPGLSLPDGGDNGEVTIGLDSGYALPQDCADGQVAKWSGGWTCAADDDTTYLAGIGLESDPATRRVFSIRSSYQLPQTGCAGNGADFVTYAGGDRWTCAAPQPGARVYANTRSIESIDHDGQYHRIVSLDIPAGAYVITASGSFVCCREDDRDASVRCVLLASSGTSSGQIGLASADGRPEPSLSMMALRNFPTPGRLAVDCLSHTPGQQAHNVGIQAIRIG